MKRSYKKLSIILASALVLALFAGCEAGGDDTIAVKTAAAQTRALDSAITVTGTLLPAGSVNVASKLTGGYQITAINVEIGSAVKKGDTLAALDTTQLDAQLAQAEAQLNAANVALKGAKSGKSAASSGYNTAADGLAKAKAGQALAQSTYDSLAASGTATAAELTQAALVLEEANNAYANCAAAVAQLKSTKTSTRNAVDSAEANVEVAQATIDLISLQLKNAVITSPMDGIVVGKTVSVGEMAAAAAPLFTIADESSLKLKGTVPQQALPSLEQGQSVDISVDIYPGTVYAGVITLISPIAVSTGGYFPVEISIPDPDGLKPGLSASAAIQVTGAQHIVVPLSALLTEDGASFVFVLQEGTAVKTPVSTGRSNTNDIEVLSGLNEGDRVIVSNVSILSEGMTVREQNGDQPQS
jgi:RND family efflux transporter MFP subunit